MKTEIDAKLKEKELEDQKQETEIERRKRNEQMALLRQGAPNARRKSTTAATTTEYDSTINDGSDATADAADVFKHSKSDKK